MKYQKLDSSMLLKAKVLLRDERRKEQALIAFEVFLLKRYFRDFVFSCKGFGSRVLKKNFWTVLPLTLAFPCS